MRTMSEAQLNIDRILEGFCQNHIEFTQAVDLLESYYRSISSDARSRFFDMLSAKLYSENFSHLNPNRTPHELIIRTWSAFGPADALSSHLFALMRWNDPTLIESWVIRIGHEFAFSLFTYRSRFSKGALDAIEAQCLLFTVEEAPRLTGTTFPPSVVDLAKRLEKIVGKIRFERFAESLTPTESTKLVPIKQKTDPPLSPNEYTTILATLRNMVAVMEQYPSAFETMGEEHLRAHFLVHLNGKYRGRATGETFNYQGKTDILLKTDGRNAFVAECKFWRGEQQFLETIDQHLSYLTWRDTRSAILVFNRNARFSDVLRKIEATVPKHPQFHQRLVMVDETGFQYEFHHPDDNEQLCVVTIMAFDVPSRRTNEKS
jgi:hypothetical protein